MNVTIRPVGERIVEGRYFYCETTQEGRRVGQIPDRADVGDITVTRL